MSARNMTSNLTDNLPIAEEASLEIPYLSRTWEL